MTIQNKRMALVCAGLAVSSVLVAAATQAQDVSFEEARNFAAGRAPFSVAVGDFNGDGVQDLVTANALSQDVSVLLGNGDGSFQTAQNFVAGSDPWSLAVGDFNGDGVQDLAVATYDKDTGGFVSVLLGNGDGSFQDAGNVDAGSSPYSVAVGDFNGDGRQDLAVTHWNAFYVSVLIGNGDGSFQAARRFGVRENPVSLAVGDFNGDGLQDLAVANNASGNVSVLLGNGDGTFQLAQNFGVGSHPQSVAVGDFNGDGVQDLAVANPGTFPLFDGSISVLLGNGDGTFQVASNFLAGSGPRSVAVGDFNGDGVPDLAVANAGSNNVSVLINNTPP